MPPTPYMPQLESRQDDPDTHTPTNPPSPGSYFLLLLLLIVASGGYIVWRRRMRQSQGAFGLQNFSTSRPSAVRLSMDDDGPAAHSFIANNASTDSLPNHALSDLPDLSQSSTPIPSAGRLPVNPALQDNSTSPVPSYTPPKGIPSTGFGPSSGRRSAKARGPVERAEEYEYSSASDDDEPLSGVKASRSIPPSDQIFDIGDDEDDHPLKGGK